MGFDHLLSRTEAALRPLRRHRPDELHAAAVPGSVERVVCRNGDRETFVVTKVGRKELTVGAATFDLLAVIEHHVVRFGRFRFG